MLQPRSSIKCSVAPTFELTCRWKVKEERARAGSTRHSENGQQGVSARVSALDLLLFVHLQSVWKSEPLI